MDLKTSFKILGLEPQADDVQTKRAYKAQVRRWHPDQFPQGSATKAGADEQLKQINLAYARIKAHFSTHQPVSNRRAAPTPPREQRQTSDRPQPSDEKASKRSWIDHLFGVLHNFAGNRTGETETPASSQSTSRRQTFEQILNEMAGGSIAQKSRRSSNDLAAVCRRTAAGYRRNAGSVEAIGGTESVGPVKPVGRVRAINGRR